MGNAVNSIGDTASQTLGTNSGNSTLGNVAGLNGIGNIGTWGTNQGGTLGNLGSGNGGVLSTGTPTLLGLGGGGQVLPSLSNLGGSGGSGSGSGTGAGGYADLTAAANATAAGNLANSQAATAANRTNSNGPGGSSAWTKNPDGTWTQNTTLSGNGQNIYNTAQGGLSAGNLATSAGDPNAINKQASDAVYNQQTQYLDPQFKQSDAALESRLAAQGITQGSEAYNNAMLNQSNSKQQAYSNAANNATTQGASVAQGLFGMNATNANLNNSAAQQTLNSNLGIMGGLNSQAPQPTNYNQNAVPGADLLGAANANNANVTAANNASIASGNATNAGLTGATTTVPYIPGVIDLEGSIILPPGAYCAFYTSTVSGTAGASFSFQWEEVAQ